MEGEQEELPRPASSPGGESATGFQAPPTVGGERRDVAADSFQLSPTCVLRLIRGGDLTTWCVNGSTDAIVNSANEHMLGGGGIDGAIHLAAGPELLHECLKVPEVRPKIRCPTGEARITRAFRLPVSHVIHAVGPMYILDDQPEVLLRDVYRNCLMVALVNNIEYIAFPAISCGFFGYPLKEASRIAISTIMDFADCFKEICFFPWSDAIYEAWSESAHALVAVVPT